MPKSKSEIFFSWSVLLLLAFIWGSSFILMKIGLEEIPFNEMAALRMLLAFLCLAPFSVRSWFKIERKYWKYLLVVGLCGNGIPAFLFAYAQTYINSSLAGMLNSLVPMFTLILGLSFFKLPYRNAQLFGVVIGLVGAVFLIYSPEAFSSSNNIYGLFVVLSTICYAISVNFIKTFLSNIPSIHITSASLLFVGPTCGMYLLFTDFIPRITLENDFLIALGAIFLLASFSTGIAIVIFNMLIKRVSALYASSVTYLIPIVAIFWGFIDGESISVMQMAGMASILTGVYIIQK